MTPKSSVVSASIGEHFVFFVPRSSQTEYSYTYYSMTKLNIYHLYIYYYS